MDGRAFVCVEGCLAFIKAMYGIHLLYSGFDAGKRKAWLLVFSDGFELVDRL